MSDNESLRQGVRRPPVYAPRGRSSFFCPLSPAIPWHWGLAYKECPLFVMERDMEECSSCRLRGDAPVRKTKKRPPRRRKERPERKERKGAERASEDRGKTE
jgi:hypothetical protein